MRVLAQVLAAAGLLVVASAYVHGASTRDVVGKITEALMGEQVGRSPWRRLVGVGVLA